MALLRLLPVLSCQFVLGCVSTWIPFVLGSVWCFACVGGLFDALHMLGVCLVLCICWGSVWFFACLVDLFGSLHVLGICSLLACVGDLFAAY